MELVNQSPLDVALFPWSARGNVVTTVIVKATLVLEPVEASLAASQEPIWKADELHEDGPTLRKASDLVPYKACPEVVLVGHAHAPGDQPARSVLARLVVGEVDKAVDVHADRHFDADGELVEGAAFRRMPLRWERAAGGAGTRNPAGLSPAVASRRSPLPNLHPPGLHVVDRATDVPTIGFGPLAPTSPGRREGLRGTAPGEPGWESTVDASFFNVAPPDQRLTAIRANERIVLENVVPGHRRLVTSLPGLAPNIRVVRPGRAAAVLPMMCDTLWIDADQSRCFVIWRGTIDATLAEGGLLVVTARTPVRDRSVDDPSRTLEIGVGAARDDKPVIPFQAAPAASDDTSDDTETITRPKIDRLAALPFGASRPAAQRESTQVIALAALGAPGITPPPRPPAAPAREPVAPPPFLRPFGPPAMVPSTVIAQRPTPPPPAPLEPTSLLDLAELGPPAATEAQATSLPAIPAEGGPLPLDEYPLARCAALAASISLAPDSEARILDENGLDSDRWRTLDKHWREAVRAETRRGRSTLLETRDRAFVGRLESERGPISAEEYAEVVVAQERGDSDATLAELGLPAAALMPVHREWLRRTVRDPALGQRVRSATVASRAKHGQG